MDPKHLLVHVDAHPRASERVALAATLARRFGARITGLFAEGSTAGPGIAEVRDPDRLAADEATARRTFEERTAGLSTDWWSIAGGEWAHVVGWTAACCRYADLAVFGQHPDEGTRLPGDALEQILEDCGRPVLVVPSAGKHADVGRRVLVAWTGSRESARALADAMPFLRTADQVSVLSIQLPGSGEAGAFPPVDVVAHLAAHGVKASYERIVVDEVRVVHHVLNRAADDFADLTVMGAHFERPFPYLPRSGTAHDLLRTMTNPVLLSR
jgi:nucleotide-binding universal stress UspA family protein